MYLLEIGPAVLKPSGSMRSTQFSAAVQVQNQDGTPWIAIPAYVSGITQDSQMMVSCPIQYITLPAEDYSLISPDTITYYFLTNTGIQQAEIVEKPYVMLSKVSVTTP